MAGVCPAHRTGRCKRAITYSSMYFYPFKETLIDDLPGDGHCAWNTRMTRTRLKPEGAAVQQGRLTHWFFQKKVLMVENTGKQRAKGESGERPHSPPGGHRRLPGGGGI